MFSAAFDERYDTQPPSRLSPILPTRADNAAKTDFVPRRMCGRKAFATSAGPTALILITSNIARESMSRADFSG
jgi:hypothetical protein